MINIIKTAFVLFVLLACGANQLKNTPNKGLVFQIFLYPSFDEKAQIVLRKNDTQQIMDLLLLTRPIADKPVDNFYQKTITLSKEQFIGFDSQVIQKTKIRQPKQWTGCCDGMPVDFLLIEGGESTNLHFRSPDIKSDSSGYELTKATVDWLRLNYNDSIIADYLNDAESYMDDSKPHSQWKDARPINRLRKIKYGSSD